MIQLCSVVCRRGWLFILLCSSLFGQSQITWEPINGVPAGSIGAVAFDEDDRLYAGTQQNIVVSDDYGDTWQELNSFPDVPESQSTMNCRSLCP